MRRTLIRPSPDTSMAADVKTGKTLISDDQSPHWHSYNEPFCIFPHISVARSGDCRVMLACKISLAVVGNVTLAGIQWRVFHRLTVLSLWLCLGPGCTVLFFSGKLSHLNWDTWTPKSSRILSFFPFRRFHHVLLSYVVLCVSLGVFTVVCRVSYLSCGSVHYALHRGVVCPKRRQCFHRVCLDDPDGWPGRCSSVMQRDVLETPLSFQLTKTGFLPHRLTNGSAFKVLSCHIFSELIGNLHLARRTKM